MNLKVGGERLVTVFLCGDVMTGRGIDQILPHPSDPRIHEACLSDARLYVALARVSDHGSGKQRMAAFFSTGHEHHDAGEGR